MPNLEKIQRLLNLIGDRLDSLEYYCETEIVGDDTRHLLTDIKGAQRQHVRTPAQGVQESYDVKPLYDRLKCIQTSLRVLRNNLDLSDKAVGEALEACGTISNEVEEIEGNDDL
jgi:hypothetical protein